MRSATSSRSARTALRRSPASGWQSTATISLTAHLNPQQRKLQNVRRDPRVTISFEGSEIRPPGLREYLVIHGTATIEEGGAPELLQELAHVYLGPEVRFPPMDDPPPGVRIRIAVERVGGTGPWAD